MKQISCKGARYIKLGSNGAWADVSIDNGELHFGYGKVPHELALKRDYEAVKAFCLAEGRDAGRASGVARQVVDFYGLGRDCLWITFARGFLWWTFAEPKVEWRSPAKGGEQGERVRRSIDGWRNTDINNKPLLVHELSTKLTQVMFYRQTICEVKAQDYLLDRINGKQSPIIIAASKTRKKLLDLLTQAIAELHWADFETLVDVVLARSGWHRVSAVGGAQKTIDLELEHPATGEKIAVQVKSRANQKTLDSYIERIDALGSYDRLFFVCHSPSGKVSPPERPDVHLWTGREFAATVLKAGMQDWVLEKIA
jgi:hypothetical protein